MLLRQRDRVVTAEHPSLLIVRNGGETLVYLGDVVTHSVMVEHPDGTPSSTPSRTPLLVPTAA